MRNDWHGFRRNVPLIECNIEKTTLEESGGGRGNKSLFPAVR